jgi:hypothetical protein
MQTNASQIPDAYRILAQHILDDARSDGTYMSGTKVWLGTIPSIDLNDPECCKDLDLMRRWGLLQFSRCDLVAAFDYELVSKSEWVTRDRILPDFAVSAHFLLVPDSHRHPTMR